LLPPGWEARLYGRQGCLPLRFCFGIRVEAFSRNHGARLCPQDQSQRVEEGEGWSRFNTPGVWTCCGWASPQSRSGEKRWRATSVQDAGATTMADGLAGRLGVRRQSGSGDGAFERTTMTEPPTRLVRAKAVSRCACHRSPRHAGATTMAHGLAQRLGVRQPSGALVRHAKIASRRERKLAISRSSAEVPSARAGLDIVSQMLG